MNELHVNQQAAEYYEVTRYVSPLPKDFKHITARHHAKRKQTERRRQRIAGVLFIVCVTVGIGVVLL